MFEVVKSILVESWHILNDSAIFVLFGFFMAALSKAFVPGDLLAKHLGKDNFSSVLKASLFGVPLPLCSCGVIPAAIGLRKQGASNGSTTAFLISTPESGIDSIAISWALLDPLMTVVRPVAAFITATVAGVLVNALPQRKGDGEQRENPFLAPQSLGGNCHAQQTVASKSAGPRGSTCACQSSPQEEPAPSGTPKRIPLGARLHEGFSYAFGGLLGDIGGWLLIGIGIAGAISFLIPADFIGQHTGSHFGSLVMMLVIGIPLYTCATSSTPIAAALVFKGLSPGAALVFLLAGPATNATTITVVTKLMGKRIAALYVVSIAVCSLGLGWGVDHIYRSFHINVNWLHTVRATTESPFAVAASTVLLLLILRNYIPKARAKKGKCGCKGMSEGNEGILQDLNRG